MSDKRATEQALATLEDVWVVYDTPDGPKTSLCGVSLSIGRGEWFAVIGHNGSGKSTLGKVLAGLCPLSKGHVLRTPADAHVRIVFQNPETQSVGQTVWEDLLYQPGSQLSEPDLYVTAEQALATVGLLKYKHAPVDTLSGGQKQRLAIAVALTVGPALLVLDEPTTMLDARNRQQVYEAVKGLHQNGTTIVWVTQRMEEVTLANRVAVLTDGKVAFTGLPQDFFYGPVEAHPSPCESLGFDPPYTVSVARNLARLGTILHPAPLTPDDLQRSLLSHAHRSG